MGKNPTFFKILKPYSFLIPATLRLSQSQSYLSCVYVTPGVCLHAWVHYGCAKHCRENCMEV